MYTPLALGERHRSLRTRTSEPGPSTMHAPLELGGHITSNSRSLSETGVSAVRTRCVTA